MKVGFIGLGLGIAGGVALALSLGFLGFACTGLRGTWTPAQTTRWARRFFFASLLYLPALIAALVVDVLVL